MTTTSGDRAAVQSKLLMVETGRLVDGRYDFSRMLSAGVSPTITTKKVKQQSSELAPIIRITDLEKRDSEGGPGDHVELDMDHRLTGMPIMGNQTARGKEDRITSSKFTLKIDMARYPVEVGTTMDQQRRYWNLEARARRSIVDWSVRLDNEWSMYHAIGGRGYLDDPDLILPAEDYQATGDGSGLNQMMVNPISPPTHNRSFFCGANDAVNSISGTLPFASGKPVNAMTAASTFSLTSVQRLKRDIEEMVNPPPKARLEYTLPNGKFKMTTPIYILAVTTRMWESMRSGSDAAAYRTYAANALRRTNGWDHPLFQDDHFMVGDILVVKYPIAVRYYSGRSIPMRNDDADGTIRQDTVPAGFDVDRGVLIGGQMLAQAHGSSKSGQVWNIARENFDYGNNSGLAIGKMCGMKKVVFRDRNRYLYDHGTIGVYAAVEERP